MTDTEDNAAPPDGPNGFTKWFERVTRVLLFSIGVIVFVSSELAMTPQPIAWYWPVGFMLYGILGPKRLEVFFFAVADRDLFGLKK